MASGDAVPSELKKIEKYLSRERLEEGELFCPYDHVYVLSDSKGRYVKDELQAIDDLISLPNLTFWHKGGRTTADGVNFLSQKIDRNHIAPGRSVVLFWHGTCDLNTLKRPERYLLPKFDSPAALLDFLKPSFQTLSFLHNKHRDIDIGILEIPPIFWSQWNKDKNHPYWQTFNDKDMHDQVLFVNNYIRQMNQEMNYVSPKFLLDCMEFRKRRSSSSQHRTSLTSVLFKDGVHPKRVVAQKWLYQILKSVCISPE